MLSAISIIRIIFIKLNTKHDDKTKSNDITYIKWHYIIQMALLISDGISVVPYLIQKLYYMLATLMHLVVISNYSHYYSFPVCL